MTPPCPPCCLRRAPLRQDRRLHSSILSQYQGGVKPPHSKVPSAQKLPQWCLTGSAILKVWALPTNKMRTSARFLAILIMAALLAPSVRWTSPNVTADACGCPPGACLCVGHHHGSSRLPACCMGTDGQCGMQSPDSYISAILSTLTYVPTEHPWWNPIAAWSFCYNASGSGLLPSHARIPDQPPRFPL